MENKPTEDNTSSAPATGRRFRRLALEWAVILGVFGLIYAAGLHTQLLAYLQRGLLATGLVNAQPAEVLDNGPRLTGSDYRFAMTTPEGDHITLEELQGELLFINIWASWCPPCIAEMPSINRLHDALSDYDDIRFLMISVDEDRRQAVEFMNDRSYSLPVHFPASSIPPNLHSGYLPTTYVVSGDGQILYKKEGIANYNSNRFREWLISQRNP